MKIQKSYHISKVLHRQLVHSAVQNNNDRRVVVTGIGVVSPIGCGLINAWNALLSGKSGLSRLEDEGYKKLPSRVAAFVPRGSNNGELDLSKYFSNSDLRSMSLGTAYGIIAAQEALETAKWKPTDTTSLERTGVAVGVGMVDLKDVCDTNDALIKSYSQVNPYFVTRVLPSLAAGHISIRHGFEGPVHTVSTACATGSHAIGDAYRFIKYGDADVMVCGGTEACISPLSIAAFCRIRALSTKFNDRPQEASRPFDEDRDGFVMGEGSAILVIEELTHAVKRGAKIYAEVLGYGLSGDASHLTAPRKDGTGAFRAMKNAVADAGVNITDITYINAHATSTPLGDGIEAAAISRLFGDHVESVAVSSTKGAHGHLLGAAGNLESAFTVMSCYTGWLPPNRNLNTPSSELKELRLNLVPKEKIEWTLPHSVKRKIALKNSFGFGGTNACLCIGSFT